MSESDYETYYVNVTMEVQVKLPKNEKNPEFKIEQMIDDMAETHDFKKFQVIESDFEIRATDTSNYANAQARAFVL